MSESKQVVACPYTVATKDIEFCKKCCEMFYLCPAFDRPKYETQPRN